MSHEICTNPIDRVQMNEELAFFAQYFRRLGHQHCEALFGFAWGNDYYPDSAWTARSITLEGLVDEVRRVEAAGFGQLGADDLFVTVPPLELKFRFCNDSDIHIEFDQPDDVTELFYQRWKSRGFSPAEWQRAVDGKPAERLRIG
jgi:hypothetical protein